MGWPLHALSMSDDWRGSTNFHSLSQVVALSTSLLSVLSFLCLPHSLQPCRPSTFSTMSPATFARLSMPLRKSGTLSNGSALLPMFPPPRYLLPAFATDIAMHQLTIADVVAPLETHYSWRRPLRPLSFPATTSWLRRANPGAHKGREAVHGHMCWTSGSL